MEETNTLGDYVVKQRSSLNFKVLVAILSAKDFFLEIKEKITVFLRARSK